jgi:hypothetical protein
MSIPPPGPSGGPDPESPLQLLAEHFEATFNHHDLTLTDEPTATAYRVCLQLVRDVLTGAEARGVIDGGQRAELDAMIEGMAAAPGLIGG